MMLSELATVDMLKPLAVDTEHPLPTGDAMPAAFM